MEGLRRYAMIMSAALMMGWAASPVAAQQTHCGAGCPLQVACYARPSDTPQYIGYYVGGGSALGGTPRCCNEGTWGWDYQGCLLPRRVLLYWSHWRYQGGRGAYCADGPPVPNLPACALSVLKKPFHHGEHEE